MVLTTNPYEQYRQQGVMTASPTELVVMLYDGCIRQLKIAIVSMEDEQNIELANIALLKAQAIVQELASSLDPRYEIALELNRIYIFIEETIVNTITSRQGQDLKPLVEIIQDLHEAWQQVSRQTRATNLSIDE